ncbi:MAG: hypothetical protein HC811_08825 [Flammeovirgaceae bacterium]|nr:hypothetical protein [Flammeovirgaceae bacterium]
MELLESQDPEKKKLIESSERHLRALQKEADAITDDSSRVIKNALLIGGVLALGYLTVNQLVKRSKKKKKKLREGDGEDVESDEKSQKEPSVFAGIGEKILTEAAAVLVEIARVKLEEYLQAKKIMKNILRRSLIEVNAVRKCLGF